MLIHQDNQTSFSDEEIIQNILENDRPEYFEFIYLRYHQKIFYKCLSFSKERNLAIDWTHDVFVKIYFQLKQFKNQSKFSTWVYVITYHFCIDQLKKNKKLEETAFDEQMLVEETIDFFSQDIDVNKFKQGFNQLNTHEQMILTMFYEDDIPISKIGELLGLGESAVKMRLKRSKEKIKKYYESN